MEWETKKGWVSKQEGVERDKKGVSEQVRKNWMDASVRKRYPIHTKYIALLPGATARIFLTRHTVGDTVGNTVKKKQWE